MPEVWGHLREVGERPRDLVIREARASLSPFRALFGCVDREDEEKKGERKKKEKGARGEKREKNRIVRTGVCGGDAIG